MIARIEGKIIEKKPNNMIVDVSGVGFWIEIPLSTYFNLPPEGEKVVIFVEMHVREDSIRLFGFASTQEKELFKILTSINRVGPKLAMNILSGMDFNALIEAILENDVKKMATIPGIGKKSAERILFEIKEKQQFIQEISARSPQHPTHVSTFVLEVVSILENLGYKKAEAEEAVDKALKDATTNVDIQTLVKRALKCLSGRVE